MTTRTADRVDEWDSRPFTDGYEELRALSEQSFSGAVTAGRATLYMLNGTVVGIIDGSIGDFEDASGTVFEAPTDALALLAVMQDRGDEVRAKYYSEETALAEADRKLSEGGFTGYVELSENVLSGDYYVVYHGGKSMSIAFVGESERLLTDDEAFEQADEEVGIYKVRPVDVEPIEIPDPEPATDTTADDTAAAAATDTTTDDAATTDEETEDSVSASDTTATESDIDAPESEPSGSDDRTGEQRSEPSSTSKASDTPSQAASTPESTPPAEETTDRTAPDRTGEPERVEGPSESADDRRARSEPEDDRRPGSESAPEGNHVEGDTRQQRREGSRRSQPDTGGRDDQRQQGSSVDRDHSTEPAGGRRQRSGTVSEGPRQSGARETGGREPVSENRRGSPDGDRGGRASGTATTSETGGHEPDENASDGTAELEHRTIPSVDPDRTWTPDTGESTSSHEQQRSQPSPQSSSQPVTESTAQHATTGGQRQPDVSVELEEAHAEIEDLTRRIDELEAERDELETTRSDLADERDDLQAELERVRTERDELQAELEDLREQLADARESSGDAGGQAPVAETTLNPAQAIDGTNLFVRYESKGDATLKAAHEGSVEQEAVNANLNLEYHTGFDASDTAVGGQPYDEFLVETIHYRFVDWVVRTLLYEIRDTGHQDALADLYDALPLIDRAELNGSISVAITEDGEEKRTQEQFDVVLRDRMGNPLVVTNLNDSREAATDEMMTSLVTAATRVGESSDHLAGAFFVTSSFFDPDALETAAEASGGGILSRDKRESFVRLSRKDGFHLCLVESRDGGFHLAVPEL